MALSSSSFVTIRLAVPLGVVLTLLTVDFGVVKGAVFGVDFGSTIVLEVEATFPCLAFAGSSFTARLCFSLGSQAIAVQRASVPLESQEQVLQSSLNTALGVQV